MEIVNPKVVVSGLMPKSKLHLILLPTERCNFRCTYCYESFELGRMSQTVVDSVKMLINREIPRLNTLSLAWFGGEPLQASSIVLDISRHAMKCVHESNNCKLEGNITTNGHQLGITLATELVEAQQGEFHITLDGPQDVHDKTRRMANGRGTFEQIWCNLISLRNSALNFKILLRLHAFRKNLYDLHRLMPLLIDAFGDDSRFRVYLAPVEDYGGEGVKSLGVLRGMPMSELEIIAGFQNTPWFRQRETESQLRSPYICYASQPRSFAIRSDGSVVKCTHALDDPRNAIGHIDSDGFLQIDKDIARPWMRGFVSKDAVELACPLKGMEVAPPINRQGKTIEIHPIYDVP
jgi:uncharacterized protein